MTLDGTSNKEARLDPPAYPIRSCPLPLLSMVWQSLWNEMESQPPLPLFLFSDVVFSEVLPTSHVFVFWFLPRKLPAPFPRGVAASTPLQNESSPNPVF